MDAKIIVYGSCLVAIFCGATFWSFTMEIDEVQKDVFSARQQLAVTEESLKKAKAWLAARKEAAALVSAAAIIEKQNETLRNEISTIRAQRSDVAKVYTSSIERARNELVGTTLPEVKLASGTKFTNAKIQSLDSEITVIHHSGGVSKVPTADLPPEIKDRLRFGFNPGGLGVPAKEKKETSSRSNSNAPMNSAHRTSELLRFWLSKQLVSNNERWCHQRSVTARFSCQTEVPCINEPTKKSLSLML